MEIRITATATTIDTVCTSKTSARTAEADLEPVDCDRPSIGAEFREGRLEIGRLRENNQ